jgi:antitoxin (DNA-binding transcriptional repressor) of toxin-antitoxin stability system
VQVQVAEAKRDFSKLIRLLETGKEEAITVSRNGKPIVRMVYILDVPVSNRIGIAEGKFKAPDDFDANNEEIYAMLAGGDQ